MSNQFLTISMITREGLRILKNQLVFTANVNRDFDKHFAVDGAKIGYTVNVRKPARYLGRSGPALSIEDVTETSVPVTLSNQDGCDISISTADLALSIDQFAKTILAPMIAQVSNKIDSNGLALYRSVANSTGVPGAVPSALLTYLTANAILNENAAPKSDKRCAMLTPVAEVTIVDALKGLFNATPDISKQYQTGKMGTAAGLEWYMDQNVYTHTVGPLGGSPAVNGAGQTGSNLVTNGWTGAVGSRLLPGDVIQLANVSSVNPMSRQSTNRLQSFVVTAPVASDVSGNATIPIYPPITPTGAFQTVNASPANGALISVFGTAAAGQAALAGTATPQLLVYHPDAFTLAVADLPIPQGVHMAARVKDEDYGISLRAIQAYSIQNDQMPLRLDVLSGWAALRPELACRISS